MIERDTPAAPGDVAPSRGPEGASGPRLRIGLVAPPFERVPPVAYGGTERIVHALAVELDRRGHAVTVFASADSDVPGRLVPTVGAPIRDTGAVGAAAIPWMALTQVMTLAAPGDLDVLHAHLDWAAIPLGHLARIPVVVTFHGRVDLPASRELLAASRCHHVAISADQASTHPSASWAGIVHNGLDLSGSAVSERPGDDLCFVGRLVPEKGILEAIEVARLSGRRLRVAAKLGAQPAEVDYYERVVRPAMRTADVEHLGELSGEERDQLFAESHATLMPGSWPEPFGLVAIESMACGTPVLTTRVGALPEIVREGVDGFFGDDAQRLAFHVPDVARLDRAAIRASVLDRFSAARMADGYLEVYRRVLEGPHEQHHGG
ncbi:MAG: glycosyltransferase family 4 protein [Chloroflexi bacterium]|nr:glycosyltransferase family 4 protein [Chloroflexota bacterium]